MDVTGAIAIVSVFGVIPLIIYLVHRNRERMALIEKGLDVSMLESTKRNNSLNSLKFGILLIGLAVGILVGNILDINHLLYEEVAYFSMIFLFGGLALLAFYAIAKRHESEQ